MNQKITFTIIDDRFPSLVNSISEYEKHCVTYLIHNDKQIYIGETSNFKRRILDHSKSGGKKNLLKVKIITSEYFNKSAVYDIETKLINYIYADNNLEVLNTKLNQNSHEYYMKSQINDSLFKNIWAELQKRKLARRSLQELENTNLFKYSPFKEFSDEQYNIINEVIDHITEKVSSKKETLAFDGSIVEPRRLKLKDESVLIHGAPGTGKSLLIVKIVHKLLKHYMLEDAKIAICVPQSALQSTFKKMLKESKINAKIIKPIDMSKNLEDKYDLLIVDEAHRLKKHFNKQTKDLKHLNKGEYTELDFAKTKSKHLILMYDEKQAVRPADLDISHVSKSDYKNFKLTQQFRVKKSTNYLCFIEGLLQLSNHKSIKSGLGGYDFRICTSIDQLYSEILKKEKNYGQCRLGSGYFVKWISKKDNSLFDFEQEGIKIQWNTKIAGWAQDPKSINEIGCIHTLQGQDLNYAGIIIGDDIYLDPVDNKIKINPDKYFDQNGTPINGTDIGNTQLTRFIKNIYYVLLTRGMLGTYVYIKDPILRDFLSKILSR